MKKYNKYLLESVNLSNSLIIEILTNLKDKNIIKKIILNTDKKEKSILINVVESNDYDTVKFLLNFDININHIDKAGNNVLFYVKSIKMFKLLYEAGADASIINNAGHTTLLSLARKSLFNSVLYKKIIDNDNIDITISTKYNESLVSLSLGNLKTLSMLLSYNNKITKKLELNKLYEYIIYKYMWVNKSKLLSALKLLLDNNIISLECSFFVELNKLPFNSSNYSKNTIFTFIDAMEDYIDPLNYVFFKYKNNKYIDWVKEKYPETITLFDENPSELCYKQYLYNKRKQKTDQFNI